jgi:two-component system sensor histidine kinase VicK
VNLDDLALQIQLMRKRIALLQRQSEQQKTQQDIEFVTDIFKELYLALEQMQIVNKDPTAAE